MIQSVLTLALLLQIAPQARDQCAVVSGPGSPAREYAAIVAQYRSGQLTDARERVRALSQGTVDRVFVFLRANGWPEPCLFAASLIHSEVGMEAILREDPERHFDAARKLLGLVRDEGERTRLQRDWLLLMGLFHQRLMFDPEVLGRRQTEVLSLGSELFRGAQTYFDEAVEAFPRDPEILVAAGALFEWSGAPNFGERDHLAKAEKLYQRAGRIDPNDPIAQLRYGMTLWKRGSSEQSVLPLRRVLELSKDDDLVFRAHMALGRIQMLGGMYDEAIAHFRTAVAVKPDWQVGALALSHALHQSGARDESRELLEHGLYVPWTDDNLFGWWSYETGLIERFGPLLEAMRNEVMW